MTPKIWDPKTVKTTAKMENCSLSQWNRWVAIDIQLDHNAQIREYDMDNIILDLGSDVKFLQKQTWQAMGMTKLIWSPIQLRLENQHKIVLIGILTGENINIDGVRNTTHFEVIDIKWMVVNLNQHYLDSTSLLKTRALLT
jgi:hypothetical protein